MKKLICALTFGLALLIAAPTVFAGGEDAPFPLDFPIQFPWNTIEGTWEVSSPDFQALYTFEVQSDCDGRQILRVFHIEPQTGEILADGIGYKLETSDQVYVAMRGVNGFSASYMLYVGAYLDTKGIKPKRVYGLRIRSFTDPSAPEKRYRIFKTEDFTPGKAPKSWNFAGNVGKFCAVR